MKILVINAGSSSLKYQVIDTDGERTLCGGNIERIGIPDTWVKHFKGDVKIEREGFSKNHTEAFSEVCALITGKNGAIKDLNEIDAVGHRVLHAGVDFTSSVVIDGEVLKKLEKNIELGPLHMPQNITCIKSAMSAFKNVPMVAVFDTAFHSTMPEKAYMYAIDYNDYEKYKVRRYGFHGTSHKFISGVAVRLLNKPNSKIVTCHLGNGSSISAVLDGKCVDTSMGLTPLEGLVMGTRSGDIDPAAIEFLAEKKNMNVKQVVKYLNKDSGLLGISGVSSDNRDIIGLMQTGNARAKLAFDMNVYRIKKYIGAYAAVMGGLDALVFTGGIGENSAEVRAGVLEDMNFLGLELDPRKNAEQGGGNRELSTPTARAKIYVIPTNEELVIAKETFSLLKGDSE